MTTNGRPPLPLEEKRKRGTLRADRLPPNGLTEVARLPISEGSPQPPEHLEAKGRAFWGAVFSGNDWLWAGVDDTLIAFTAELLDEREVLKDLTNGDPENTRLRAALRALDKQLVSNLSLLGFTPSDRARLGLVKVKERTMLDGLLERRANRDDHQWEPNVNELNL